MHKRQEGTQRSQQESAALLYYTHLGYMRCEYRGRATNRNKQLHAIQQRVVAYALARIRARVRNELRAHAHVRNAYALERVA